MERGKRKKKPKYSLAQNLAYYFGALRKFNGRVIYMVVFGILFGALGTWLTMYIPKLILDRLEYSDGFTEIFFVIAGIFVANLLCNLVCDGIDAQKRYYNSDTWAYFNSLFEKKRLTIDYEYLQDPNIQIMKGKAWEAVSNSYSLTSIFPTTLANLGFNFICFILFGGVLGALNPLIILVLVAACVISYLPQKRLLAYMHGIKDASEAQARRMYYYSSLCRNFKIAKDVRLYAMSGWINRASAAAVRRIRRGAAQRRRGLRVPDMEGRVGGYLGGGLCAVFFGHIGVQFLVLGHIGPLVVRAAHQPTNLRSEGIS